MTPLTLFELTFRSTRRICRSLAVDLTCVSTLGYLPGHVHAFWIIWCKYDAQERAGYRRGYSGHHYGSLERQPQQQPRQQANYQTPPPQQHPVAPPPQNQPVYDNKPPAYSKN
ncbi:hypothetical protein INT44_007334 [Umbelopsis vinacea]|uniref:Uncharacterized protein n=1 Tax=Umbelopsis vinacea TaxID=44442 RepID=A0A8H7PN08_9FUNG|nr:hypothetical protein INT44_007334 [Umbelopsis vinacea]